MKKHLALDFFIFLPSLNPLSVLVKKPAKSNTEERPKVCPVVFVQAICLGLFKKIFANKNDEIKNNLIIHFRLGKKKLIHKFNGHLASRFLAFS